MKSPSAATECHDRRTTTNGGTMKRLTALLAAGTALALSVALAPASGATTTIPAKSLLAKLAVAPEAGASSYARTKFPYPFDANGDCQNTRAEVLLQETKAAVTYTTSSRCYVKTGKWFSYYDGVWATLASALQVDHFVPLQQAWVSGARSWTPAQRKAFANDLWGPTLQAVTVKMNESKGDRDPAKWLPPRAASRCQYAIQWVEVKYRWRMTIDATEKAALAKLLTGTCGAKVIAVPQRAR